MKSCTWEKLLSSSISDLKQLIDDDFNPADLLDESNAEDDEYLEEYNGPAARGNSNNKDQQADQIKIISTDENEDYEQEQWRVRSQRRKQRPAGSGLGTILNEKGKSLPQQQHQQQQQQIIPSKQLAQQEDYAKRQKILQLDNSPQLDRKSSKSLQHRRDSSTKKIEPAQYQYQQEEEEYLRQQASQSRNNSAMNRRQPQPQQQQFSLNVVNKKTVSKSDSKDNYSKKHSNSYHHYQPDQNQSQDTTDIQINHIPQLRGNQAGSSINQPAYKAIITRVKRSISDAPIQQDNYYNEQNAAAGNVSINDQGYNVTLNPQYYVPQSYQQQQQQLNNNLQYNSHQALQKINRSNVIVHPQQNYGSQSQNKSISHIPIPQKQYQEGQNINIYDQAAKAAGNMQGSESNNSYMPRIVRRQKSTLIAEKDGGVRRTKERSVEGRLEENYKQDQESQPYTERRSESLNKGQQNYSYKNYQNTNESKASFVSKQQQQQQYHGQQKQRTNQPSHGYNINSNTNITNGGGLNDSFQDQNNNNYYNNNNRMGNNNNNYNIQLDTNISSNNDLSNKNRSLMLAANDVMNSNNAYSLTERQRQMVEEQRKRIAQVGVALTQKSSKETKLVAQLLQGLRNKGKKMPVPTQERSYLFQE